MEAIGDLESGQILTVGGDVGIVSGLREEFDRHGARAKGIVAAEGTVADRGGFERLGQFPRTYLVDISDGFIRERLPARLPPECLDVVSPST